MTQDAQWSRQRVGDLYSVVSGFPFDSELFADDGVPLVRIRDVISSPFATFVPRAAIPPTAWIRDNDLAIGMDGDYNSVLWQRGQAALNQRVMALRTNGRASIEFLAYALPSHLRMINDLTYSTTVKHLASKDVTSLRLPMPTLEKQRQIAAYLDRETGQIDELIAKQEQLLTTLTEREDAIWAAGTESAAATGSVLPLRRLIRSIVDGPFGSALTSAHYADDGARVIRLGNLGVFEFRDEDRAYVPSDYAAELSNHAVLPGDVLVAGLGDERMPLGRATVAPYGLGTAIVKADCYRVRPNERVSSAYLAWAMSSPASRTQFVLLGRGTTRARLNTSIVRDVMIPVPSRADQDAIVQEFERSRASLRRLQAKATQMIALLRERRQALISAAVTGKIDVRSA